MKNLIASLAIFCLSLAPSIAQHEFSVFTATGRAGVATTFAQDYHAIGINPANIGLPGKYDERKVTFGLLESSSSIYTSALETKELRQSLFNFASTDFNYQDKLQASRKFTSNNFVINSDIMLFGLHIEVGNVGNFGFSIRDRVQWNSNFSNTTADILFLGYNASYIDSVRLKNGTVVANDPNLDQSTRDSIQYGFAANPKKASDLLKGTKIKFSYTREYNLSYGRSVISNDDINLYAGIGIKYMQVLGEVDLDGDAPGSSYNALSPAFGVDYGSASKNNPNALSGTGLKQVGQGVGFDFGLTAVIKDKIKIGASIVNLGSVTIDKNLYYFRDASIDTVSSQGFDNYNIFTEAQQFTGEGAFIKWEAARSRTTNLPTLVRLGGSINLNDKLEIGADVVIPANKTPGNFEKPIISFGGDFSPVPFLRLSTGFVYGGNFEQSLNLPLGATLIAGSQGSYEFGVATRDIITYFSQQGPTLSFALGFLRFRV